MLAAGLLWWNRAWVVDTIAASQYTPSSAVQTIVQRTGLNADATRILYATHPEISDATQFNAQCADHEKSTVILGCYTGSRIYLYHVENLELDGVTDVTAAHEMLHAAYTRLNLWDKPKVDAMITAQSAQLKSDAAFVERMKVYDGLDEQAKLDELHSVIGTEVTSISPELEAYYARYFNNRQSTVGLYKQYSGVFIALQDESKALAAALETQAKDINQQIQAYNMDAQALSRDIQAFNTRADSGGFGSQAQFAAERSGMVARVNALDAKRRAIETASSQYQQQVERYNSISNHINQLNTSLDSTLAPAPSV